jgi:hypothetical protein
MPLLVGMLGFAIDYGRMATMRTALIHAIDATGQTLQLQINLCNPRLHTHQGATQTQGCFDDAHITLRGSSLKAGARTLLEENFKVSWSTASIDELAYDKSTGLIHLAASSRHDCVFLHLIRRNGCQVALETGTIS